MSEGTLAEALARIRKTPTAEPPAEVILPPDDPSADRLTYASFPPALREGMKAAAKRWEWDRETWRYQTGLVQETLLSGRYDGNELAVAYLNPPKTHAEGAGSDAMKVGATHA